MRFGRWVELVGLVGLPLVLWLMPADVFDSGPPLCLSRAITEIDCPGCGLTRAVQHAFHGEWAIAQDYNPLVVIVFPLLGLLWGYRVWRLVWEMWRVADSNR